MTRKNVLFICTHNSARSQMAEALMNHFLGDRFKAFSAGTKPSRVHPAAIRVMNEIGISLDGHRSKNIGDFIEAGMEFDLVVTVCDNARENCPNYPWAGRQEHKGFEDPSGAVGGEKEEGEEEKKEDVEEIKEEEMEEEGHGVEPPERVDEGEEVHAAFRRVRDRIRQWIEEEFKDSG